MSLKPSKAAQGVPVFNGDKARCPEHATHLNSTVRALGARHKQAVAKQGVFAEVECAPEQDLDEHVLRAAGCHEADH